MAENFKGKSIDIKKMGLYLILLLALLRFLIYPLHDSLQEKRVLLDEWYENYRLKSRVFEKLKEGQTEKAAIERSTLLSHFYDQGVSSSYIQVEVLGQIQKLAEKNGLTLLNFEMLEPVVGKGVSEIPILIRLKGPPGPLIEILKAIEQGEKVLGIRSLEISRADPDLNFFLTLSSFRMEK